MGARSDRRRWARGLALAAGAWLGAVTLAGAQHGPGTAVRVRAERPIVRGSLPVEVAQRLLRRRLREVKVCYEDALRAAPDLEGKLVLRLVIGAPGRVDHAEARQRQGIDEALAACIVERARRWTFPSSGAGRVVVDWPIRLSPPTQRQPRGYGG